MKPIYPLLKSIGKLYLITYISIYSPTINSKFWGRKPKMFIVGYSKLSKEQSENLG
jgi:hypothetical protein